MSTDGGLHSEFKKHLPMVHFQRIETSTGLGVPDTNYCVDGREGWIENKKTDGWRVKIRGEQVGWIERRARAGGRVFVAVRQRGAGRDTLWLLLSPSARHLVDASLRDLPDALVVGVWPGKPSQWGWDEVLSALKG